MPRKEVVIDSNVRSEKVECTGRALSRGTMRLASTLGRGLDGLHVHVIILHGCSMNVDRFGVVNRPIAPLRIDHHWLHARVLLFVGLGAGH